MKDSPLFRLHFIVFLWGFTAILGKFITLGSNVLVFYRMLLASVFLFLYFRIFKGQSLQLSKDLIFKLFGVGVLMAIHWLCFFQSIKVANVSIALSCLSLSTLFASFVEPIFFKRKIDPLEVVLGCIIVACMSYIFEVEIQYKEGILFGIMAALFGTLFSVFNGKLHHRTSAGNIIFYELMGGWIFVLATLFLSSEAYKLSNVSGTDAALIILLASVFTAYPMLESVKLMKYISPFTLILTVNLEPIYGIILAFFIFGESEQMSPAFYGASLMMIGCIIMNGLMKSRRKKISET